MSSTPFETEADPLPDRFVVLYHTGYFRPHWDLMFEQDRALATWKVYHDPQELFKAPLEVFRIGDHRKHYLAYEGPVSGGRGEVRRICAGTYTLLIKTETHWRMALNSQGLAGVIDLVQQAQERWLIHRTHPERTGHE